MFKPQKQNAYIIMCLHTFTKLKCSRNINPENTIAFTSSGACVSVNITLYPPTQTYHTALPPFGFQDTPVTPLLYTCIALKCN